MPNFSCHRNSQFRIRFLKKNSSCVNLNLFHDTKEGFLQLKNPNLDLYVVLGGTEGHFADATDIGRLLHQHLLLHAL